MGWLFAPLPSRAHSGYDDITETLAITTVAIVPDSSPASPNSFLAIAGDQQSHGATPGQALDALTTQLGGTVGSTLVLVQPMRPDAWFTNEQQRRLAELMGRWRASRDAGGPFTPEEQVELESLVAEEQRAAALRSASLLQQLPR